VTETAIEKKPWIVVVGGFLGAGKTTLILAAARELERHGRRCAVIMNDQGSELVDTRFADLQGLRSGEVTGGCFCCRLTDLVDAAEKLRAFSPDVIFAEPVGSCTDLLATVLRPLQEYQYKYKIAPFTVVVDPQRADSLLQQEADPNLSFLFRKQIEEADIVCFNKADLYPAYPRMPGRTIRQVSAATGQGVSAWLSEVLSGALTNNRDTLDIDYLRYAEAEAALAWLNLQATLRPSTPLNPAMAIGPFLDSLDLKLTKADISIVHLKMIVTSPTGFVKAAMCGNGQEPQVEGALDDSPSSKLDLLLNLRALGPAQQVEEVVERELSRFEGMLEDVSLDCFTPAAPKPERRVIY
jgi:CobW/HypB/UreG, nucleotide-binding domain